MHATESPRRLPGVSGLAFLSTARIGASQKARRRASRHATNHANETTCIIKHTEPCFGYMACACACGMRHRRTRVFLCASCRWTRFSRRNEWAWWAQWCLHTQRSTQITIAHNESHAPINTIAHMMPMHTKESVPNLEACLQADRSRPPRTSIARVLLQDGRSA